jgi:hypothetical protein
MAGRFIARATAGVQSGYVFSYASGVPFHILAGRDLNNDTNLNDRPMGVSRNSARQPSTASSDVRLSRAFPLGRHRLEVMIEAFNVFNHVNVLSINDTFYEGQCGRPHSVGQWAIAGCPDYAPMAVRRSGPCARRLATVVTDGPKTTPVP